MEAVHSDGIESWRKSEPLWKRAAEKFRLKSKTSKRPCGNDPGRLWGWGLAGVAHPTHSQVRLRYNTRCGYCGVSEADTGGELTVDHYQPSSLGGDDSDDNLVYARARCNAYKQDFFPAPVDLAHGRRILHPLRDDLSKHLRLDDRSGCLEPLTVTGEFHMAWLRLNRPSLTAYRLGQKLSSLQAARLQFLEAENAQLKALLAM